MFFGPLLTRRILPKHIIVYCYFFLSLKFLGDKHIRQKRTPSQTKRNVNYLSFKIVFFENFQQKKRVRTIINAKLKKR